MLRFRVTHDISIKSSDIKIKLVKIMHSSLVQVKVTSRTSNLCACCLNLRGCNYCSLFEGSVCMCANNIIFSGKLYLVHQHCHMTNCMDGINVNIIHIGCGS